MLLSEYKNKNYVFVIAEIAQAHDGNIGFLHSLVKAAASTGVDAIKFQVHIAEAESSVFEPFRTSFSSIDKSRFDYWKRMELNEEQWLNLKSLCESLDVEFLATPCSISAVNLLEKIGVSKYKIGSADLNNLLLIEKVKQTGKELIISGGMSSNEDLISIANQLRKSFTNIAVLQCTSEYPTSPQKTHLCDLSNLLTNLSCPVGISDHSATIFPGIAAVALGATIVEAHVTFDRRINGPDASSSLEFSELKEMVNGIRFISKARISKRNNNDILTFDHLKKIFGRSLAVNSDLKEGDILTFEHLECKKPLGYGIPVERYKSILGKKLKIPKLKWDFLKEEDFYD